jgi:SAM-dependent methyltransferase
VRRITPDQRHKEITREEFSRQVVSLSNSPAFRDERVLDRIATAVAATRSHRVLDLACGPGLVSRRLARDARFVVGVDLTPAMLERASEQAGPRAAFALAAAERLPLASGSCERAVTRLALHHLPDPGPALREMARVVAPGGRVVVADIASSENARDASLHNELERLRDPSHVRMLPPGELLERMADAGLPAEIVDQWRMPREFDEWLAITGADERRAAVRARMNALTDAGEAAGIALRREGDTLRFEHHWLIAVAGR